MSYPGLFRAGILSILRPGMPPAEVRALEQLGRFIFDSVSEYAGEWAREPWIRSEVEEHRYVLEVIAGEIKGLVEFLTVRYSDLKYSVEEETLEYWSCGFYADYAARLRRHLSALSLQIERVLDPSREEVRDWRASLPKKIPNWNRNFSSLTLPARSRRPVSTSSGFVAAEAEADLKLVQETFDLLRQRTRELREGLRPHEGDPRSEDEETRRITELALGLDGLVSLVELCYGQTRITLEGDPDAEPDDGP